MQLYSCTLFTPLCRIGAPIPPNTAFAPPHKPQTQLRPLVPGMKGEAMPERMAMKERQLGLLPVSDVGPACIIDTRNLTRRAGCEKEECHRG